MLARRGVTLLELMTVVIVVGILAMIAIPQFFQAQERVRGSEAMQQLGSIRGAQLRWRSHSRALRNEDVYTLTDTDLDFNVADTTDWAFTLTTSTNPAKNPDAIATRTAAHGGTETNKIYIDLNGGNLCANNTVYGLPLAVDATVGGCLPGPGS